MICIDINTKKFYNKVFVSIHLYYYLEEIMFKSGEEFPIYKLCSKDIQCQYLILLSIYQSYNGLDINELMKITKLSKNTVYKYILIINSNSKNLLKKEIVYFDNKHYCFDGNKVDFALLRLDLFENSIPIKLLTGLLVSSGINLYKFCLDNFISESTLRKCLRLINNFLSNINIDLVVKKNEIYLTGDEAQIRYCFASIFWRVYYGLKWPFSTLSKNKIDIVASTIFTSNDDKLNESKQEIFNYFLSVNILRSSSGHKVSNDSIPCYYSYLTEDIFFHKVSTVLLENFVIHPIDIKFIMLTFYIFPEFYLIKQKISITLNVLKKYDLTAYYSILNFKKEIQLINPHKILSKEDNSHLLATLISGRFFLHLFSGILFHIYDLDLIKFCNFEFPNLLPSIQNIVVSQNPGLNRRELKVLSFKYSQAYVTAYPPQSFERKIKILLKTDVPIYIENLLINRIKLLLDSKYNYVIRTKSAFNWTPDIILTTDVITEESPDCPTIYILPQLSKLDSQTILLKFQELTTKKL